MQDRSGPLTSLRVVEFSGFGPGPFCGMMLSDQGADVVIVDRPGAQVTHFDVLRRGRPMVALDLKSAEGHAAALELLRHADALIDPFRPGVMERLGLGPAQVHAVNPRIVYVRLTGWGQGGPLSHTAGHDINYSSLTGAIHAVGLPDKPLVPLNFSGDFGAGGMMATISVVAGVLSARETGKGQVIDCAMVDGSALLMSITYGFFASGLWRDARKVNPYDGGAHNYDTYQCADGEWISIAPLEPQFYAEFLERMQLDDPRYLEPENRALWPELQEDLIARFKTRTRAEWCALLEGTDVCFAPVLGLADAPHHPHIVARDTFIVVDGVTQPNVAPRFGSTQGQVRGGPQSAAIPVSEVLARWQAAAAGEA